MLQLIQYLDAHNGAIMVVITLVYVVATITICFANMRSAKATLEQLEESRKQYEEEHRAYITYEIVFLQKIVYGIRFTNHGRRIATDVHIQFSDSFVNSIESDFMKNNLLRIKEKSFTLGIGQSYDLLFGERDFRNRKDLFPIEGKLNYRDRNKHYSEELSIDFALFPTFYYVSTEEEKTSEAIQKMAKNIETISHELQVLNQKSKS